MATASGEVEIAVETRYPWEGSVAVRIVHCEGERVLRVRKPEWCERAELRLNGTLVEKCENGYYVVAVRENDCIEYDMDMSIKRVYADDRVAEDRGRVAVMRGPVVYCAEEADNPGIVSEYFHAEKALPKETVLTAHFEPELLGGVVTIVGDGVRLVPYYAWDNREPGAMVVWMKEI